jgi:hypothetical protein
MKRFLYYLCRKSDFKTLKSFLPILMLVAFPAIAGAQSIIITRSTETAPGPPVGMTPPAFQPNSLYAAADGALGVYRIDNLSGTPSPTLLYRGGTGNFSTMAVGRWNGNLVAYHWDWDGTGVNVVRVTAGTTATEQFTVSRPGTAAYNYWSGGEVNQQTGEIYFSGGEDASIGGTHDFSMMIYNPYTGVEIRSGELQPKTPGIDDNLGSGIHYVMSDMALDANGNAYILVEGGGNKWLLRVVPSRVQGENWYYNKVVQFTGLPFDMWGMAFLGGYLYGTGIATYGPLYRVNPLSGGAAVNIGRATSADIPFDLASDETASIIEGTIYHDVNGNGILELADTAGVSNQIVELYEELTPGSVPILRGTRTTGGDGFYSFMLDKNEGTYFVRLKRPKIRIGTGTSINDSIRAVQTWASAGRKTQTGNPSIYYDVTAYTHTDINNNVAVTADSTVLGSHFGADPNTSTWDTINPPLIYSKVAVNTSLIVAVANFGITAASDYGDAAESTTPTSNFFPTTIGGSYNGPAHLTNRKLLYLGKGAAGDVTTDTDASPTVNSDNSTDDGVYILDGINEISPKDTIFEGGETYTFKIYTKGPKRSDAYLNAWYSYRASGSSGTITQARMGTANMTPDANGIITFQYLAPTITTNYGRFEAYMRFRFSNVPDLNFIGNHPANNNYWGVYGEVEDYLARISHRRPPNVTVWPSASLTYGTSLAGASLSGGSSSTPGTFAFQNGGSIYPKVSDSNTTDYVMVFTPTDYEQYYPISTNRKVTVSRKSLNVTGLIVAGRFYKPGITAANVKEVLFGGLVLSDTLKLDDGDYTVVAQYGDDNIGTGKSISSLVVNLSTNVSSPGNNYSIGSYGSGYTGSILPAIPPEGVVISAITEVDKDPLAYSELVLTATDKGLRLPQLSSTARDILTNNLSGNESNARGLLIYNTDADLLQYWQGSAWLGVNKLPASVAIPAAIQKTKGIMTIGSIKDPDYFAVLELESTTQGLLVPQLTQDYIDAWAFEIAGNNDAKGLLAFNTNTQKIEYWNGTRWNALNGPVITDNSGTNIPVPTVGGVIIGIDASPPFYSILQVSGNNKGVRLPQLTSAIRSGLLNGSTPSDEKLAARGLLIYNTTTNKVEFWDGTEWCVN